MTDWTSGPIPVDIIYRCCEARTPHPTHNGCHGCPTGEHYDSMIPTTQTKETPMKYIIISQHGWHIIQEDLNQPGALEQLATNIGITQWVEDFTETKNHGLGHHYPKGAAMLLKVEAVIPEAVETVTQWKLP